MDEDLTQFCQQNYPRLVGALDLYCGDLAVAEELAQEALTRAWLKWPKVRAMERPDAWVSHVAFNLARSHLRRVLLERRVRARMEKQDEALSSELADALALRESLARLRHRARSAVILRFYLQMTYAEIAETMDIPEATARTLVHRALPKLREDLTGREVPDVG